MIFVIRPHSFIDVITNSSSELFVMRTEKSMDLIMKVLKEELEDDDYTAASYIKNIFTVQSLDQAELNIDRDMNHLIKAGIKVGDIVIVGRDTGEGAPTMEENVEKILRSRFNLFYRSR